MKEFLIENNHEIDENFHLCLDPDPVDIRPDPQPCIYLDIIETF